MIRRLLTLSLVIGFASVAQAGVVLDIKPGPSQNPFNPCGVYDTTEAASIPMQVTLAQTDLATGDHLIRLIELHFDTSDAGLLLPGVISSFAWEFGGAEHYKDESLASGPDGVVIAYKFAVDTDLGPNPTDQLTLPGNGTPVVVATFNVTMPAAPGSFSLDVLNSVGATGDDKAAVIYGFDCDAAATTCPSAHPDKTFPVTIHRAGVGITGGSTTLQVVNQQLASAVPADGGVLPRTQKNIMSLDFSVPIDAGIPVLPATATCDTLGITISELQNGGITVPLNPADFECFGNPGDNTIFHVRDLAANLANQAWYRVADATGTVVAGNPWAIDQRVGFGDVNRSGITAADDIGLIWGNRGGVAFDSPYAMSGSAVVGASDVGLAWGFRGAGAPFVIPTGHDCQ